MKVKIEHKGKEISIDVKKCVGIKKFTGLMTNRKNALLFEIKNEGIHSLFCPRFLAIWVNDSGKIVEYRFVEPWKFYIKPEKEFSKLIEIPLNGKYSEIIEFFGKQKK